jgi:glycine/D-amino acid oxidase-like deaminating enzyme
MIQRAGPDAIVVGAGIVGAACAAALARDGWRVTVLDRAYAAAGTTSVGMGHVVVMDDSPEQLALTAYSAQLWRDLRPQLDARAEFDACGTLWIAEDLTQLDALEEKRATYRSARVAADVIDARELRDAEPGLRDDLLGALLVPDDAVIYPPGATIQLLDLARQSGATVREGIDVREIIANGVRCRGETLHADVVINAAGAAAQRTANVRQQRVGGIGGSGWDYGAGSAGGLRFSAQPRSPAAIARTAGRATSSSAEAGAAWGTE